MEAELPSLANFQCAALAAPARPPWGRSRWRTHEILADHFLRPPL